MRTTTRNKVPEVILWFWVIKVMATTVGETAADYLNDHFHLGLTRTTLLMSAALIGALAAQLRQRAYVPAYYWSTVVLISVLGTLVTDNLTDQFGVSLWVSTAGFSVALMAAFGRWYQVERTLSIHTITTPRREAYYWLAILLTFALGTAAGDLIAEQLNLGYWRSGLLFAALIAVVSAAWKAHRVDEVLAFWMAYVLTRPLGASIGDYLSQPQRHGGLAMGSTRTSAAFVATIVALVVYLTRTKRDQVTTTTSSD
jgi:uncharacterized membrane-anchored protein